ncbi:MAG: hypothetical protein U1E27_11165, partial [Kiritimatiellia bacterium]|nr:hypothetical protein [Kiritimatiellia bacterium]
HSMRKGYGLRYWEIGNEVYLPGTLYKKPGDYVRHFVDVSQALKKAQPEAKIGLSMEARDTKWGNYLLKAAAGHYDFVCPHLYGGFGNQRSARFEDLVLVDNHEKLDLALEVNALLKAYNPDRDVFIYDSEWGLHSRADDGGHADRQPRNGNIIGMVYRAVRLLYYARENVVQGASGWKSLTNRDHPGFAILYHDAPEARPMLYWLHYYFNRGLEANAVSIRGSVPYYEIGEKGVSLPMTPVMATASEDGSRVRLMLVNASWDKSFPARILVPGFQAARRETVWLTHDDPEADPFRIARDEVVRDLKTEMDGDTLVFTLPGRSVVFILLERAL